MLDREHKPLELNLAEITVDEKYQVRDEGIDESHVQRLADIDFDIGDITRDDPVIVFGTGVEFILVDGGHRFTARKRNNRLKIWTICYSGTERDALLYSLTKSNSDHGMPLSRHSRVLRAEKLFLDKDWGKWSLQTLANKCREPLKFLGDIRRKMINEGRLPEIEERLNPPPDLEPELVQKWDKVKEKGQTPVITERDGKKVVEAKRGAKERKNEPKENNACDASGSFRQKAANLKNHWTDEYGNPIPNFLKDTFVSGESLAGIMRADVKYLRSIPINDWMRDNPWLAQQSLKVQTLDPDTGKVGIVDFSVRRVAEWLISAIDGSHPAGVCPVCNDGEGHCDMCHNKRWLPSWVYESVKPVENPL